MSRAVEVARHHRLTTEDVARLARLAELADLERLARMTPEEAAAIIAEAGRLGRAVELAVEQEPEGGSLKEIDHE